MLAAAPDIVHWMHALGEATRLRALRALEKAELTVAELRAVLQLPQSTVSRHLKVLSEAGWVASRREGTSALYRMTADELPPAAMRMWTLVREQISAQRAAERDDQRLQRVLADRRTKSQAFFASMAGRWDKVRSDLFGERFDALALPALLDASWTVGDLGCGTARVGELLAPYVERVIAVDSTAAMLKAARSRLKPLDNVDLRRGELEQLPIDDRALDAAVLMLVLHHQADPAKVLGEVARTLKRHGKVLIVDMLPHDRREYQQSMGHVWLGFDRRQIGRWLDESGFTGTRLLPLPIDPNAKGPALFAATAMKEETPGRRGAGKHLVG